jgi:putative membrane protein
MKRSFLLLACSSALLLGTAACNSQDSVKQAEETNEAKNEASASTSETGKTTEESKNFDAEFMAKAASGGMLEVQLGQAVASKGTTAEGKEFASMMVKDHTKANAELKGIAAKKNITLPATLGEDHQKVFKDVTEEKGADMDKEYLKEMVKDHEEDVKEFREASEKASDPEIKAFATKQVPVLQHHLEMAQKMSATLEKRK